jgi:hypothetical protein
MKISAGHIHVATGTEMRFAVKQYASANHTTRGKEKRPEGDNPFFHSKQVIKVANIQI